MQFETGSGQRQVNLMQRKPTHHKNPSYLAVNKVMYTYITWLGRQREIKRRYLKSPPQEKEDWCLNKIRN
jgi:hypothetical protein